MYWMVNRRSVESLQQAGFTKRQIHRLTRLRKKHLGKKQNLAQDAQTLARLQFARWLVLKGKLTEQLPQ